MMGEGSPTRDWTIWVVVFIVVLLAVVIFVMLASTYFPVT
jgi:ABC-type transporter Mla subunit MlaD